MREIWNSWSVHPAVLRGRMDAARESMRETYRIWRETMDYRNRVYERANEAWDQVIRGVTTIEDTWSGRRWEVDLGKSDRILRRLNRYGERYRAVPPGEQWPAR
jgi:hypothetical protein